MLRERSEDEATRQFTETLRAQIERALTVVRELNHIINAKLLGQRPTNTQPLPGVKYKSWLKERAAIERLKRRLYEARQNLLLLLAASNHIDRSIATEGLIFLAEILRLLSQCL